MRSSVWPISVEKRFFSDFLGLPKDTQKKVARVVDAMRSDPDTETKSLTKHKGILRRRVGDYRVLFARGNSWIHLYAVQHRGGVYGRNMTLPKSIPSVATSEHFDSENFTNEEEIVSGFLPSYMNPNTLPNYGLEQEQVSAVMDWDGDLEGLATLSDIAVPEALIDELLAHIHDEENQSNEIVASSNVRLVKSNVLDAFWAPLQSGLRRDHPIEELIIVSPWITPWEGPRSSFTGVINFIKRRGIPTRVITRPPEKVNHKKAIDRLKELKSVEITELPQLHAKFYVCDMGPAPVALVGSANSTKESFDYDEVGVLVHGRADLENFVRELISLSNELRTYN